MKIVLSDFEQEIDFSVCDIWEVVIENAEKFFEVTTKILKVFDGNIEEGISLLEHNQELFFSKNTEVVYNYYDIDINSKKIQNLVYKHLTEVAKENDFNVEIANINRSLGEFYSKLLMAQELNVFYESEPTVEAIIKMANFKFEENSIFEEKIVDYVDMINKLKPLKLVVFININQVLSTQKVEEIIKQLRYLNLNVLFVNSNARDKIVGSKRIILDNDLCEI